MTLKTFGSNATTSLRAVQFFPSYDLMTDADLALFNLLVQPNYGGVHPNSGKLGTYVSREGQFFVPQRGWVKVFPGDWLVLDVATGYPFVLSMNAVASGPYTHT